MSAEQDLVNRAVALFKGLTAEQRTAINGILTPAQQAELVAVESAPSPTLADVKKLVASIKPIAPKVAVAAKLTKPQMSEILAVAMALGKL